MSHDLFAAFGSPETEGTSTSVFNVAPSSHPDAVRPPQTNTWQDSDFAVAGSEAAQADEEDDFGDFEDASAAITAPAVDKPAPKQTQAAQQKQAPPQYPRPRSKPPEKLAVTPKSVGSHPFAGNMDLLFAADDDEEYNAGADDLGDLANNPEAAMAYSKRVIAAQLEEESKAKSPFAPWRQDADRVKPQPQPQPTPTAQPEEPRSPNKLKKKSGYVPARAPNVLFDADNLSTDEDNNDFGDFEDSIPSAQHSKPAPTPMTAGKATQPTMPALNLLGMDDSSDQSLPAHPTSRARGNQSSQHSSRSFGAIQDDEAWDDFEDSAAPADQPTFSAPIPPKMDTQFQRSTSAIATKPASNNTEMLPPTNIPPPAVLLSIFPSLFASAQDALFNPLAKLDFKQRQMLLAHPATHMFLSGYLSLSIVLGHIVAGRKLRWKRDQYLAQGMRIGPSAAGGKGGMKLAGVDKSEVAKEDREVLDAVRQWKAQVGLLRSAVTATSSTPGVVKLPSVPEIAEQMPVKALKPAEGGVTATHACALCGLKREERVAKVDVEVDDSFGEWWVQGMSMHLLCRNFWDEHKGRLKSR